MTNALSTTNEVRIAELFLSALLQKKDISPAMAKDILNYTTLGWLGDYGRIEYPGPAEDGCLWFSPTSMAHSYTYDPEQQHTSGTRIYQPKEIIFNSDSLLYGLNRTDHIQTMSAGEWLSIPFTDVRALMTTHGDINNAIQKLAEEEDRCFRRRTALLKLHPLERVGRFTTENGSFIRCSTPELQAIHVNLPVSEYREIVEKQG
ncbi:hypothetical protein [Pedobacter faecalis]|uniref:hypothetical protein n=1 Tax=Pedobacter faecalis TaxID=3041495 RepID=UPI0025505633|nr:hypothetical protein [Pedobacter sp. ELA7]